VKWLAKLRCRLFGAPYQERYKNGWKHAVQCVNEGLHAVELLENQLDAAVLFGSWDAFDEGARDALRRFKPQLLEHISKESL
jgi:hypothetical protein